MQDTALHSNVTQLLKEYPSRFSKKEKTAFLDYARNCFKNLGYNGDTLQIVSDEQSRNLVIGNLNAPVFITAHYDTPAHNGWMFFTSFLVGQTAAYLIFFAFIAIMAILFYKPLSLVLSNFNASFIAPLIFPMIFILLLLISSMCKNKYNANDNSSGILAIMELARMVSLDKQLKEKYCFVLFDNEECGTQGSAMFAKWCEQNNIDLGMRTCINIDCIGAGEDITIISCDIDSSLVKKVSYIFSENGATPHIRKSNHAFSGDHVNIQGAITLCKTSRSIINTPYLPNIHSNRDKVCNFEEIQKLCKCLIKL